MSDFRDNFKHAERMFRMNPGFTFAAIAALALGIGINTAIFTVVDAVLLKPLTYPDADRIVQFLLTSPQGDLLPPSPNFTSGNSRPVFFKMSPPTTLAVPASTLPGTGRSKYTVSTLRRPISISLAHQQSWAARLPPRKTPQWGKVVVLSYGLWQRKFAGNPNVIGTALSLGNEPYTIVGVLGKSFVSNPEADILLPFQFDPNSTNQGHYFMAAGRLKPGVTVAQANALLKVAADQFRRRYPDALGPKDGFEVEPLRDSIVSDARTSLLVMLGAVSLVLLIACANVANLLLVHATGRKREFAIRAAMGAGPKRIVLQLLTESVLLSLTGGVLGLLLGYAGLRALLAVSPADIPRIGEHGAAVASTGACSPSPLAYRY